MKKIFLLFAFFGAFALANVSAQSCSKPCHHKTSEASSSKAEKGTATTTEESNAAPTAVTVKNVSTTKSKKACCADPTKCKKGMTEAQCKDKSAKTSDVEPSNVAPKAVENK